MGKERECVCLHEHEERAKLRYLFLVLEAALAYNDVLNTRAVAKLLFKNSIAVEKFLYHIDRESTRGKMGKRVGEYMSIYKYVYNDTKHVITQSTLTCACSLGMRSREYL